MHKQTLIDFILDKITANNLKKIALQWVIVVCVCATHSTSLYAVNQVSLFDGFANDSWKSRNVKVSIP